MRLTPRPLVYLGTLGWARPYLGKVRGMDETFRAGKLTVHRGNEVGQGFVRFPPGGQKGRPRGGTPVCPSWGPSPWRLFSRGGDETRWGDDFCLKRRSSVSAFKWALGHGGKPEFLSSRGRLDGSKARHEGWALPLPGGGWFFMGNEKVCFVVYVPMRSWRGGGGGRLRKGRRSVGRFVSEMGRNQGPGGVCTGEFGPGPRGRGRWAWGGFPGVGGVHRHHCRDLGGWTGLGGGGGLGCPPEIGGPKKMFRFVEGELGGGEPPAACVIK